MDGRDGGTPTWSSATSFAVEVDGHKCAPVLFGVQCHMRTTTTSAQRSAHTMYYAKLYYKKIESHVPFSL